MKTALILSLLSFLFHIQTNAQNTIEGRVTDKVTRQPLESATVTLQQEGDGNIINYTGTYQSSVNYRTGAGSSNAERSTDSFGARMGTTGYLEI